MILVDAPGPLDLQRWLGVIRESGLRSTKRRTLWGGSGMEKNEESSRSENKNGGGVKSGAQPWVAVAKERNFMKKYDL